MTPMLLELIRFELDKKMKYYNKKPKLIYVNKSTHLIMSEEFKLISGYNEIMYKYLGIEVRIDDQLKDKHFVIGFPNEELTL